MRSSDSLNADHRRHDRLLIARFAADDSYPGELEEARTRVAACNDCAALADEIGLLSRAVATLPAARRTRDFRLTAEQAESLRGSWFERLMRRLAAPGWASLRPVAGVAISIGLVLVVVGALPASLPLASVPMDEGSRASDQPAMANDTAAPTKAGPDAPPQASAPPQATGGPVGPEQFPTSIGDPLASPATEGNGPAALGDQTPEPVNRDFDQAYVEVAPGSDEAAAGDGQAPVSSGDLLVYGGLLIAVVGLSVLLLAFFARRRYGDPLLR